LAATLILPACYNYNLTDPNNQTLSSLVDNPTRASVGAAVAGIFDAQRQDGVSLIWRLGSMGREGINLSGNNQPDYQEPYFGPLSSSEFGASDWGNEFVAIRDANIVIAGHVDGGESTYDRGGPDVQGAHVPSSGADAGAVGRAGGCRSPGIRRPGAVRQ
jgi:hypothetical protein